LSPPTDDVAREIRLQDVPPEVRSGAVDPGSGR
jgi:hypothetical protein